MLGLGWGQALFTVVIALVFAQVSPVDWQLAEDRVLDVAVGAAIGLADRAARVAARRLRRAAPRGRHLPRRRRPGRPGDRRRRSTRGAPPGAALPRARDAGELASASWALYQTEHHPQASVDWQATLLAGQHAVRGAEGLRRECPSGRLLPCVEALTVAADDVAARYDRVADALVRRDREVLTAPPPAPPTGEWPTHLGADLYHLADLHVWLDGLRDDLSRIAAPSPTGSSGLHRLAHLADEQSN